MGNVVASKKAPTPEPLEIPELIRQSSKSQLEVCSICLESRRKGILCSTKEHFICQDCFAPYVSSVVQDAGKMKDSGFTIQCCFPDCSAQPWSSHEARLALDGAPKVLDQYMDALVRQLKLRNRQDALAQADMGEESVDRGLRSIVDALTLGCPFCHMALDPTPDGCAAMRCESCSKYFCFLCFNIQQDNSKCHAHVRQCPSNPSQNVFPPQRIRDAAQKQLRVEAVRKALSSTYGLHWRQHSHTTVLLEQARDVLRDSFISPAEVLEGGTDATAPLVGGGGTQADSAVMFLCGFVAAFVLMHLRQWSGFAAAGDVVIAGHEELTQEKEGHSYGGMLFWIFSSIYWLLKHSFFGYCYVIVVMGAVNASPELARLPERTRGVIIVTGIGICFYMSLFEVTLSFLSFVVQYFLSCIVFVVELLMNIVTFLFRLCLALLKLMLPLAMVGGLLRLFTMK